MDSIIEMFGEPISVYTSTQAIEDGCFVRAAPGTCRNRDLMTRAVFERIKEVEGFTDADVYGMRWDQRVVPLLQDAGLVAWDRREHLWTAGLEGNLTGQTIWIGRNDLGGLTLMFPEDY